MMSTAAVKIGVALTDPEDWTARAFVRSIEQRGAEAVPINLATISTSISTTEFTIFDAQLQELVLDALLVRDVGISFALEEISLKHDLVRLFEASGIPVMNSSDAIQNAANKFYSFYLFRRAGLPIPRTVVTAKLAVAVKAVETFRTALAKPTFGSQGKGIVKLESSHPDLAAWLTALIQERGMLYLQEFVPNPGRDIRVFVVGDEALAAIYRVSSAGAYVSNLSQGGRPLQCELTAELQEFAVRATRAIGADFAGVDLLEGADGLVVLEINGTPSGKGINLACGVDVTDKIITHLFERLEAHS
jgi:tetrahydromethanopterin:alpha-L-glutamate ligase